VSVPTPGRAITDWNPAAPAPAGFHTETRVRSRELGVSLGVLVPTYFVSALAAAVTADSNPGRANPAAALWVPGVGPFIQMATTTSSTGNLFLAIDGAAQTAAIVGVIYALASPRTVLAPGEATAKTKLTVRPAPLLGSNLRGAGLVGSF